MSNCDHSSYNTFQGVKCCNDCGTESEVEPTTRVVEVRSPADSRFQIYARLEAEMERPQFVCRGVTLPDDIRRTIDAYVAQGTRPGSCLTACIDNNLGLAVGRANDEHLAALPAIVGYLFERCDMRCWGHANACEDWIARKSRDRLLRRAATQVEAENFL